MYTVEDVKLIELKVFSDNGILVATEGSHHVPFPIKRVFHVQGVAPNTLRGDHAHKVCKQAFQCLRGVCDVVVDDGAKKKAFRLEKPNQLIYVPETVWAAETYTTSETLLLVYCDEWYRKDDYIRDYKDFLKFRGIT
jgi:UDP-2-acetamido-3-amino-2,3-dideoxy-glucuronate N-acetyltransferase